MKLALLTLALCLPALATKVHDSDIRDSAGQKILSGVLKICPPGAFASGAWWISADCVTASIASGVIDVSLVPGHYYVHWQSPARDDQMWFVPDSGTPLRIADAVTSSGWPLIALPPLTGSGVLKDVAGALDLVAGTASDCVHVDSSSGPCGGNVSAINGTTFGISPAADQVAVTTAPGVATWTSLADCVASGKLLRYSVAGHSFSCPTLGTGDLPDLSLLYEAKDSTILRTANFAGSGSASTVAHSDHNHAGSYEPVDITILRQGNLSGSGSALTPARSDHTHAGVYETASTNGAALAAGTYCMTVNGSSVKTWGACPTGGGGGGGALSWATLTNGDWTSMSNSQWTTMTN